MSGWQQRIVKTVLFPCPASSYTIDSFPGELVWIPQVPPLEPREDGPLEGAYPDGADPKQAKVYGEPVPCLLLPYESARFLVIFFHSNAEDLGKCRWFCHFMRDQFQVHVLAVEYPGYGVCSGPPTREGVIANAHAALQFAMQALKLPLEQIMLFGRSIGTGPALQLASRFKVGGVVLVTPFLTVRQLFQDRVGPFAALVEEWFDNDAAIKEVTSPTMITHGKKDVIIPWQHSEALYKNCWARKIFVNPAGMEHNTNLTSDISYLIVPMFRFFSLPDYSFEELQVPAWALDKRRSPLYVRPDVEVCSRKSVRLSPEKGSLANNVPTGDAEEDEPLDEELTWHAQWESQGESASDGSVLTHPTVRHAYQPTKMRYNFASPYKSGKSGLNGLEGGEEHGRAPLRHRPLGDHESASMPGVGTHGSPGGSGGAAPPRVQTALPVRPCGADSPGPGASEPGPSPLASPAPSSKEASLHEPSLHSESRPEFASSASPQLLLQQSSQNGVRLQIHRCPI